jgi:hypothetical protein
VLAGGWRADCTRLALSPGELDAALPVLLATGAAGIASRRLVPDERAPQPAQAALQQAARFDILQAALRERQLVESLTAVRARGLEPILAKGWAVSRYYAEQALRPSTDIDLYFHRAEVAEAVEALFPDENTSPPVDLHADLGPRADRTWEEVLARSQVLPIGSTTVRVLCEEDHLRHLCLHLWGHSAWRPLWLCDIGAMIEGLQPEFDWDLCLAGTPRYRNWIACAVALARDLLEARIDSTPFGDTRLPAWLRPALLKQWERCLDRSPAQPLRPRLRGLAFRPPALLRELRTHWPDAIEVTFAMDRPINSAPRVWYQLGAVLGRVPHLLRARGTRRRPNPAAESPL